MHDPENHQGLRRLWLFAGTAEGPQLAHDLLAMGWRLRLSLVTADAGRAYGTHPHLEITIGAVGNCQAIGAAIAQAQSLGDPYAAVVDATHPFARTISSDLAAACCQHGLELWRLQRQLSVSIPSKSVESLTYLNELAELAGLNLAGVNFLLAIGQRQLAQAISLSPGALHHARLLPNAANLQVAMAAGLAPNQVACLRPTQQPPGGGSRLFWANSVEAALLQRWQIKTILARESGGSTEACWRSLAEQLKLNLLLIRRPVEAQLPSGLSLDGLLAKARSRLQADA